ncbi:DUF397 domain-containing protein [Streptomyces sp. TS71-3]|uniref:DUF397 domain-containing protein n=1 Tax=Streptomyces sp. TS71-3 TaxID=2733862 RepID=UPI001B2B1F53|nr:DUF397 domain-containing protein [Streptomyces sp. TS71-3]GHJ40017.1 toxin [Streptomyces sp. TS71-3]
MNTTLRWFKSSYSDSSGGQCLEVAHDWHKSTYSNDTGGQCVEISTCPHTTPTVHIRDSKTVGAAGPAHPRLAVSADAWSAFLGWAGA